MSRGRDPLTALARAIRAAGNGTGMGSGDGPEALELLGPPARELLVHFTSTDAARSILRDGFSRLVPLAHVGMSVNRPRAEPGSGGYMFGFRADDFPDHWSDDFGPGFARSSAVMLVFPARALAVRHVRDDFLQAVLSEPDLPPPARIAAFRRARCWDGDALRRGEGWLEWEGGEIPPMPSGEDGDRPDEEGMDTASALDAARARFGMPVRPPEEDPWAGLPMGSRLF